MFPFRSPPWDSMVYWSLDLETSGLSPTKDDILSVGMVPVREGTVRLGEAYYSLVRLPPAHKPSAEAMKVHHILPHEAVEAPALEDVMAEVTARLAEGVLLVHFGRLDIGFLRQAARRLGRDWRRPRIVDTVRLLARLNHRRSHIDPSAEPHSTDLGLAREELGLPPHTRHHALYDALATAELFLLLRERLGARKLRQLL